MNRRSFLGSIAAATASRTVCANTPTSGRRLADAARAQLGVTRTYDPSWVLLKYPGGDVDRSKGVCADVVIRAARDGLGLDLQMLVHGNYSALNGAKSPHLAVRVPPPRFRIDQEGRRTASGQVPDRGTPMKHGSSI
jgi:uncharacterized protein YijF (DUF1287 family)